MRLFRRLRAHLAERLARAEADLYAARAVRARHLHALSGGRLTSGPEGWEVRSGLRVARWSPLAGCYVLRSPGRAAAFERSAVRAALWLRALPRSGRLDLGDGIG